MARRKPSAKPVVPAHISARRGPPGRKKRRKLNKSRAFTVKEVQEVATRNRKAKEKEDEPDSYSEESEDYSEDEDEGRGGYRRGGYHPVQLGEVYKNRYIVESKLGWGHFSTVWLASDKLKGYRADHKLIALKVQKSAPHYTEAAEDEIALLRTLREHDPEQKQPVVGLLDSFPHLGPHGKHVCLVFEVLGANLLSLIKQYDYRGVPLCQAKAIAKDILRGLDYMHRVCKIIHTDLKPENIMLMRDTPINITKVRRNREDKIREQARKDQEEERRQALDSLREMQSQKLSKNQKKRLKKKLRKIAEQEGDDAASEASSSCTGSVLAAAAAAAAAASGAGGDTAGIPSLEEEMSSPRRRHLRSKSMFASPFSGPREDEKDGSGAAAAAGPKLPKVEEAQPDILIDFDPPCVAKIGDMGNACWTHKHFTDDITTRQYRAPETILGLEYDTSVDIWSFACLVFELLTGDFLFNPKADGSTNFTRDEDHLAQIIELLGDDAVPPAMRKACPHPFFSNKGALRNIPHLEFWGVQDVLEDKYKVPGRVSRELTAFLLPMLDGDPACRVTAEQALQHEWLDVTPADRAYDAERAAAREDDRLAAATSGSRSDRSRSPSPPGSPRASLQQQQQGGGGGSSSRPRRDLMDEEEAAMQVRHRLHRGDLPNGHDEGLDDEYYGAGGYPPDEGDADYAAHHPYGAVDPLLALGGGAAGGLRSRSI